MNCHIYIKNTSLKLLHMLLESPKMSYLPDTIINTQTDHDFVSAKLLYLSDITISTQTAFGPCQH